MSIRDLIPRTRGSSDVPATGGRGENSPFLSLHRDMNRLFDDMLRDFGQGTFGGTGQSSLANWPSVEITEADNEVRVTAEMSGMDEKDVEVLMDDGVLVLRGEKRSETEDKDRRFSERFYGRFERRIPLGNEIDQEKINARFKNGLLTITMPRNPEAQSRVKRIAINGEGNSQGETAMH
jgi:HSP20 family protein